MYGMLSLDLSGKTALVSGSSQGIGLASAQLLASLGAKCVLLARNEVSLKKAITTLESKANQQHEYLLADFNDTAKVKKVVHDYVIKNPIHILVNNTGGPAPGDINEAKPQAFLEAFNQHLICNHLISTEVIPSMKDARYGRIINIISTSVKIPLQNLAVSNTIRAAVAAWAKTMSNELAEFGITVNNVLPGTTATSRLDTMINNRIAKSGLTREEAEQEMLQQIPAKRFGKPEEIGSVVAFLASPAAAYVNGTSIPVDGGKTGCI